MKFFALLLLMLSIQTRSQVSILTTQDSLLIPTTNPRTFFNATNPGNYQMIAVPDNTVIDPGDRINVDVYFTGYGAIRASKVSYYPSNDIFDVDSSGIYLGTIGDSTNPSGYGFQAYKFSTSGIVVLGGIRVMSWKDSSFTSYFDYKFPMTLASEGAAGKSPMKLSFKTRGKINSGNYSINLGYTYFNGVEWRGNTQEITFTVRNSIQRYEFWVWLGGIIGIIFTIIAGFPVIFSWFKSKNSLNEIKAPAGTGSGKQNFNKK